MFIKFTRSFNHLNTLCLTVLNSVSHSLSVSQSLCLCTFTKRPAIEESLSNCLLFSFNDLVIVIVVFLFSFFFYGRMIALLNCRLAKHRFSFHIPFSEIILLCCCLLPFGACDPFLPLSMELLSFWLLSFMLSDNDLFCCMLHVCMCCMCSMCFVRYFLYCFLSSRLHLRFVKCLCMFIFGNCMPKQ